MRDRRKDLAQTVIRKLRTGQNLLDGVEYFSAGREKWFTAADEILQELERTDESIVRFVKGGYGDGKTHFIANVRSRALKRNWVCSYVEISDETRLNHFQELFSAMIKGCVTRQMLLQPDRRGTGLKGILDEWVARLAQAHSRESDPESSFQVRLSGSVDAVLRKCRAHGDFSAAVRAYVSAKLSGSAQDQELLLRWFGADNLHLPKSNSKAWFQSRDILTSISRRNAKEILRSLASFLIAIGYAGTVIFLDELDLLLDYTARARREAYINLRELIDNVDGRHGMRRVCLTCAIIPELTTSEKGFSEYAALAGRIQEPHLEEFDDLGLVDFRATVADLKKAPLTSRDHLEICRRIRGLHALARDWRAADFVSEERLKELVALIWKKSGGNPTVRNLCITAVTTLELVHQNRGKLDREKLAQMIQSAVHGSATRTDTISGR